MLPKFIDEGSRVVLLLRGGESLALVEDEHRLAGGSFPPLRLGNRRNELRAAAAFHELLRWLIRLIQFPMPLRALVGRIENRTLKEGIGHTWSRFSKGKRPFWARSGVGAC